MNEMKERIKHELYIARIQGLVLLIVGLCFLFFAAWHIYMVNNYLEPQLDSLIRINGMIDEMFYNITMGR